MPHEHHPLQPTRFRRAIRLGWVEWIGVPLLGVLPVLSLSGQLGPIDGHRTANATLGHAQVNLDIQHPERLRHKAGAQLWVRVHNAGPGPLEEARLLIDEAYLGHFSPLRIAGGDAHSRAGQLHVALPRLAAGEHSVVRLDIDAADWGRFDGAVALAQGAQPATARLAFSTWVWP